MQRHENVVQVAFQGAFSAFSFFLRRNAQSHLFGTQKAVFALLLTFSPVNSGNPEDPPRANVSPLSDKALDPLFEIVVTPPGSDILQFDDTR